LEQKYQRVLGNAGITIAARISYVVLLGALFTWYLLARAVKAGLDAVEPVRVNVTEPNMRIILNFDH
jgi:hypothetical protein